MTPASAHLLAPSMPAAASVLAQNNFGDIEADGIAGPMALLIILLLIVATVLLIRNMNARLRRLPEHFPSETTKPEVPRSPDAGDRPENIDSGA